MNLQFLANKWIPYQDHVHHDPLLEGIYTDDSGCSCVGRGIENNNYVIGRVQFSSPKGLHYLSHLGEWSIDTDTAEYLIRNHTHTYKWVDSSFGEPVNYGVSIRRSSSYWPMYIGRFQVNSTYFHVGAVQPSKGITFNDGHVNENFITHYQVLTCTTTVRK